MAHDFLIIGGGIVGLSTAWQLQKRCPGKSVLLLEKEDGFAQHQTGRNSGVIHAGIYYQPGSLKAQFCKAGVEATLRFCRKHQVAADQCGKLIVATNDDELTRLHELFARAQQNGLEVELIDGLELSRREPNVVGKGAIFLKTTGIVDYPGVVDAMVREFENMGGKTRLSAEVVSIDESSNSVVVALRDGTTIRAGYVIACGGLQADRLASMQGLQHDRQPFRIIPFRGEYYQLPEDKSDIVSHLIYPVPRPGVPFLGIHLTRMIDGSVTIGPNALQGWKREGYGNLNFNFRDTADMVTYPGFWRLGLTHWRTGGRELWMSLRRSSYLKQVQRYCPSINYDDLQPYRTGVRAMAVDPNGNMIDDFLFAETHRSLHVCNAPSPAATSAIPIGEHICDRVLGAHKKTPATE